MVPKFAHSIDMYFKKRIIKKILFLDDEKAILEIYKILAEDFKGIETHFMEPSTNWEARLIDFSPDLIISDVNMPHVNVLEFMNTKISHSKAPPYFIFYSGDTETSLCNSLLEAGALGVFSKDSLFEGFFVHLKNAGIDIE
jgi:CheY-like chemotaxis protein